MSQIQIFDNPEFGKVTTAVIDGKEHFAATECAKALGYAEPEKAIRTHCKMVSVLDTIKKPVISHGKDTGHTRDVPVNFISEGDLFRLIINSRLPSAERFERWVFDVVLPTFARPADTAFRATILCVASKRSRQNFLPLVRSSTSTKTATTFSTSITSLPPSRST